MAYSIDLCGAGGAPSAAAALQAALSSAPLIAVVLLRHLACNCAADRLLEAVAALRAAGLAGTLPLFVVSSAPGAGAGAAASLLRDDAGLTPPDAAALRLRVLLDPSRALYTRLRCARGVTRTLCFARERAAFNIRGLCQFPLELLRGRVPGVTSGDPWQLGGVFLLAADASGDWREAYALREERPGWPLIDVDALRAAAAACGTRARLGVARAAQGGRRRGSASPSSRRRPQRSSSKRGASEVEA